MLEFFLSWTIIFVGGAIGIFSYRFWNRYSDSIAQSVVVSIIMMMVFFALIDALGLRRAL